MDSLVLRQLVGILRLEIRSSLFGRRALATYFLAVAQGSMLLVRATDDRDAMARNLEYLGAHVRSLFERSREMLTGLVTPFTDDGQAVIEATAAELETLAPTPFEASDTVAQVGIEEGG